MQTFRPDCSHNLLSNVVNCMGLTAIAEPHETTSKGNNGLTDVTDEHQVQMLPIISKVCRLPLLSLVMLLMMLLMMLLFFLMRFRLLSCPPLCVAEKTPIR